MKSQTVAISLLGAAGTISTAHYVAMDAETWCLTYLSTYLAPVSHSGNFLPSTARGSGDSTTGGLLRPTDGRETLIQTTMKTDMHDVLSSGTSPLAPESFQTSLSSSDSSGTSSVDIEPTQIQSDTSALASEAAASTLTDESVTSLDPTSSIDPVPTSGDISEPAGRAVIFQIIIPDNEKRNINKRATRGFVGNESPDVCTFATNFNLADAQLFDSGVPIFYSGEDFKELSGQGSPPPDAIGTTFETSGEQLVFRNSGLPNGEARFCQNSNGVVYIVFTTGPSSCVPVNLAVYNVEQCQDGRLIGIDESTSTSGIANSETVSPETTGSEAGTVIGTSTEGLTEGGSSTSAEGIGATEAITRTDRSSDGLDTSTSVAQSESIDPASSTLNSETPTAASSDAANSPTSLSSFTTTGLAGESSATVMSTWSDIADDTATNGESLSSSLTDELESETSTTDRSLTSIITTELILEISTTTTSALSDSPDDTNTEEEVSTTETNGSASITRTFIEPEDSATGASLLPASDTTSEVLAETSTSAATKTSETGTTTNLPTPDETASTDLAGIEDTTTANVDAPTTTDGDTTVQDTTTAALETTTTAVTDPCLLLPNPYLADSGDFYELSCSTSLQESSSFDTRSDISFEGCINTCASTLACEGVEYSKPFRTCNLLSSGSEPITNELFNVAFFLT